SIGTADLTGGGTERVRILDKISRLTEVRLVEQVVHFHSRFNQEAFANPGLFGDYEIPIVKHWAIEAIAANISQSTKWGKVESGDRRAGLGVIRSFRDASASD